MEGTNQEPKILVQTEHPAPTKQPFLHWSRGLFIVLIGTGFGIVVILGAFLLANTLTPQTSISIQKSVVKNPKPTQIQNETANWKTFSDPQVNATFQYPPTWILEAPRLNTDGSYHAGFSDAPYEVLFDVIPEKISVEHSIQQFLQQYNPTYQVPEITTSPYKNNSGIIFQTEKYGSHLNLNVVYKFHNGKVYTLVSTGNIKSLPQPTISNSHLEKLTPIDQKIKDNYYKFELMITTFKFTDQSNATDMSN